MVTYMQFNLHAFSLERILLYEMLVQLLTCYEELFFFLAYRYPLGEYAPALDTISYHRFI